MAVKTLKCNHLTPLRLKGLTTTVKKGRRPCTKIHCRGLRCHICIL